MDISFPAPLSHYLEAEVGENLDAPNLVLVEELGVGLALGPGNWGYNSLYSEHQL